MARRHFLATSLVAIASCRPRTSVLRVAAASSLAPAFDALRPIAERHVGMRVACVYGATGLLARQIEQGAPFDVFASADVETPARLERQGQLLARSTVVFARGRLVMWVAPDRTDAVRGLADLRGGPVQRIAIANPEVAPFGRAAREALVGSGLWEAVRERVVQAENVRQAYEFAVSGNADVAFTSASVVTSNRGRSIAVASSLYTPIEEAAGVVAQRPNLAAARSFLAILTGPEGRAALDAHGFDPPPHAA